jgi:hypothetical protein
MEHVLIFSGALAMIIGLLAVIEGHLGCLAHLRRKKGAPWSPRQGLWSAVTLRNLLVWWR